jgi:hypothetical protein
MRSRPAGSAAPVRWCDTKVDISKIRTTRGDLNEADIIKAITPHIEKLANAAVKELKDMKAIAFLPMWGVQGPSPALNDLGIRSESLDASSRERDVVIDQFRKGYIQVLVNCMLFGEGFDVPDAEAVILVRPTKSRPLYAQMVGRVTRPKDGKNGIIIDFPWVSGKHSLIKPTELFDRTGATDEVYKIAEELLDGMKTDDLWRRSNRPRKSRWSGGSIGSRSAEKKVSYRRVIYDPLAVGDVLGLPMRQESDSALRNRATPKQVELLAKFGIMCGHAMSRRRASKMLDIVFGRMKQGLCTIKQCACLIANDVDPDEARSMSKVDASIRIGQLIGR